jgi:hypothetical protein
MVLLNHRLREEELYEEPSVCLPDCYARNDFRHVPSAVVLNQHVPLELAGAVWWSITYPVG